MLGLRTLTVLVALPVFLLAILFPYPWFTIMVVAIGGRIFWEYTQICAGAGIKVPRAWGILLTVALIYIGGGAGWQHPAAGGLLLLAIFGSLSLPAVLPGRYRWSDGTGTLGGILYVAWPLSHWLLLRAGYGLVPTGFWPILYAFICTWLTDTGAYFVGRYLGKHPLAPAVSPKKTYEGAVGGLLLGAAGGWYFARFVPVSAPLGFLIGGAAAAAGQVADLLASALKRHAGVKDSGTLLPGHGGLIDRFDSALVTVPLVYYALAAIGA